MSETSSNRPGILRSAGSLAALLRAREDLRVVAPATSKQALIAAIYRAVEAPPYAAANYDALADVLGDLEWLAPGPVRLAWAPSARLPAAVHLHVLEIMTDATRESEGRARPLQVYLLDTID